MAVAEAETETSSQKATENDSNKEQYLFFLEFFVHYIAGERLAKLNQRFLIPTSVQLKFLTIDDDDAMEITPVDSTFASRTDRFNNGTENIYSGRSILFAIPHKVVVNKKLDFNINVKAVKKMPEINSDIVIGVGDLNLSPEFAGLRKEMFQCWHRNIPPPKEYEGPVELHHDGQLAGFIKIFVGISALGQSIITEIEKYHIDDKKSFIFKSDSEKYDERLAYHCNILSESMQSIYDDKDVKYEEQRGATYYWDSYGPPSGANIIDLSDTGFGAFQNDLESWNVDDNFHESIMNTSKGKYNQICGSPLVLKVSGQMDEPEHVCKSIVKEPEVEEHDIFILRVGKKGIVGDGEKSDFQIEMKTPRGPDRGRPIRYETREMQTDVDEEKDEIKKPDDRKKKKKKGKDKKEKKKKK